MIVYFSDRKLNIIGHASTKLPKGQTIKDDLREEEVETGVATFECVVGFDNGTRSLLERCTTPGNYILRCDGGENEFYTITERETDTKNQEITVYAEDAGLDLLNEIVGEYEADKAYPITHYIEKFAYDSGFEIGTNEVASLTRKLSWDGDSTITERIASIATQFDGAEVSYSFKVKGMQVVKKFINIYKKRGKDVGVTLRLNSDIDRIITTEKITNLATALLCTGGTPENAENPINLSGYSYDDGDFFTDGRWLKSRKALEAWNRYTLGNGWIVKPFEYDTTDQKTLCTQAIAELKKAREMEVNYEVEISKLPENARIGDRVNIVDDLGNLYVSARILKLKSSAVNQEHTATIGEYLIKDSGISQKVSDLAAKFAQTAQSAARALSVATTAGEAATAAKEQANIALEDSQKAQQAATEAATAANNATQAAQTAQQKANDAQAAVDSVEESVAGIEATVANAQAAAEQARQAAETAETKATEAHTAAVTAGTKADEAATAAGNAQTKAEEAEEKADTAKGTAEQAKTEAEAAATTAAAAKLDAENAQKDIDSLGESLTTLSNTMTADYARKTELTETTASLQTQITQNAAEISSTASRVQTIDETANNAAQQAQQAQTTAGAAQAKADQAAEDAQAAQTAANSAAAAASSAQSEADAAKAAAATAKSVADKAEEDLEAAKADLATVSGRVDATEADIIAAQEAVTAAQGAADKAKADAEAAAKKATDAQGTADTAVANAATAQSAANDAAIAAATAQQLANEAKGNAATAQAKADEAAQTAATAQETANTAKTNAENAQTKADQAATTAANAQKAAEDAEAKASQAEADLATAQQNLENVTSRVDATEEEVEAAQQAVATAQAAANQAKAEAATAQTTADQAKADATAAQTVATNAKTAADNAQAAADDAQAAADAAQEAVDALAVRVTTAETQITQNSEQIQLRATKEEVTQTLAGYATTAEMEAAIAVKADEINLSVDSKIDALPVSGRNLLLDSKRFVSTADYIIADYYFGVVAPVAGKTYTLRLKGELGSDRTAFRAYGASAGLCTLSLDGDGLYSATFEWGSNNAGSAYLRMYNLPSSATTESTIEWIKLEEGVKATDWTPAPEETEVEVGGRNYILDSAAEIVSNLTGSTVYLDLNYPEALKESTAEEFVVSFDAKYESEADALQWGFYFRQGTSSITQRNPSWMGMTTEYKRYTYSVKYNSGKGAQDIGQVRFAFSGGTGTAYVKNIKLETGGKVTDWTPAPEDQADAVDVEQQFQSITESMADLQVTAGQILGRVASVETKTADLEGLGSTVEQLQKKVAAQMTPEAVELQIKTAMESGTEKVVTSTGYRFDEEGLTVEKSGSEMKTQITDNGMAVYQSGEKVLDANNSGVDAKNLHATTYLIVGANSRFEDYGNGRTGCFWIGG